MLKRLLAIIAIFALGFGVAQEFAYPLKAPIDIFRTCDSPMDAVMLGYCVVDGDTVKVLLDKGDGWYQFTNLRITGVNTPEKSGGSERETEIALLVKTRVIELFSTFEAEQIKVISQEKAKFYGRTIGDIGLWEDQAFLFGNWFIENNLAEEYNGEAREDWTDERLDVIEEGLNTLWNDPQDTE